MLYLQESGSVAAQLEAELAEKKNCDVKVQGAVNAKKDALKSEQKRQKEINKNIADVIFFFILARVTFIALS